MSTMNRKNTGMQHDIPKTPTGIAGLDQITEGGFPKNRSTLICGGPGAGKTIFGIEFLINGANNYNEPGVFFSFEEKIENLISDIASLGYDLNQMTQDNKLRVETINLNPELIQEAGEYDLEGLFIQLQQVIEEIGAKRVVLDTIEALFTSFQNPFLLRSELKRLFQWLAEKGLTTVITAEVGRESITRNGLEEYISDCVIVLDNRVNDIAATRRLRIIKYRGSPHRMNEYPFLVSSRGIWILPISNHENEDRHVSNVKVSTGIPKMDEMLQGGFYKGSSILLSGSAGVGKTSVAATLVNKSCSMGESVIYYAFEETQNEILRNMASIGLDLKKWIDKDLLRFQVIKTTDTGLEEHLLLITKEVQEYKPSLAIVDSISAFQFGSNQFDVKRMMIRLGAYFKEHGVTNFFTHLIENSEKNIDVGISSLIDTHIYLRYSELNERRNRQIYVAKSRGVAIDNRIYGFSLGKNGIEIDRDINEKTIKSHNKNYSHLRGEE